MLLALGLWSQTHANTADPAIQTAKRVVISALDSNLPSITLEYFLTYESGGASVEWEVIGSGECPSDSPAGRSHDLPTLVRATIDDVHAQRSAAVVVDVKSNHEGSRGSVSLCSVTVTDERGRIHSTRLIALSALIHSPGPRLHPIRDLPSMVGVPG